MKAVVLQSPQTVELLDVPMPAPAAGEVVIDIKATSICGSDILRVFAGHAKTYPLILGHEFAGIITEVAPDVSEDWIGQRVAIAPLMPCMKCNMCAHGWYSACKAYSFVGSRRSGGLAEFCAVPVTNLVPLPEAIDFEVGAILEPATVALHALERGGFQPGQNVAVLGVGSVGQYIVQWARIRGAGLIIATDMSDNNLETARAQGATHTFNPKRDDLGEAVAALVDDGIDLVLEAVGRPETMLQAIAIVRPRGTVVCVGNQTHGTSISTDMIEQTVRKELHVNGTWMSYSKPFPGHEWTDTVAAALEGKLEMRGMISHRPPLAAAPDIMRQIDAHTLSHRKIVLMP